MHGGHDKGVTYSFLHILVTFLFFVIENLRWRYKFL